MDTLWDPSSYQLNLLSAPFALALVALIVVLASAALMRGATVLRGWFLLHVLVQVPYAAVVTIAASTRDPHVVMLLFRVAVSFGPMASATGMIFQLALIGQLREWRWLAIGSLAAGILWIPVIMFSPAFVTGVRWIPAGMYFGALGTWAWVPVFNVLLMSGAGLVIVIRAIRQQPERAVRRQWRRVLIAAMLTWFTGVDVAVAGGHSWFPLGWISLSAAAIYILRALWFDDLLRVRGFDARVPLIMLYLALTTLTGWAVLELLANGMPAWAMSVVVTAAFLAVRIGISMVRLIIRGGRRIEGPLDRILQQFVVRADAARTELEVAALARDVVQLATGITSRVVLAASAQASEAAQAWLVNLGRPLVRDELELLATGAMRTELAELLDRHEAAALVPVVNSTVLLAIIVVPMTARRRVRRPELEFFALLEPKVAGALVLASMARSARERVAVERDLELAAAVQTGFIPSTALHQFGAITVVGSWQAATQCGGDFWACYPLGTGRTLVAVGDVTGHGVASALVTASAKGALDVMVRALHGERERDLELNDVVTQLDRVVRRIGGRRLHMTFGAAILDSTLGRVQIVSAGHVAPYLARPIEGGTQLSAIVARGNPLGSGDAMVAGFAQRDLAVGDVLIWYTDGFTDCEDAAGKPYGERRLQRKLRQLDVDHVDAQAIHDDLLGEVVTHLAGRPPHDDFTLVIASAGLA